MNFDLDNYDAHYGGSGRRMEPIAVAAAESAPLNEVFRALAEDMGDGRLGRTSLKLAEELDRGADLQTAMRAIDNRFPRHLCRALVASAETGQTAAILQGFAEHQATSKRLRRQIRSAMLYPIVVVLLLATIVMGLMLTVAPQFAAIYRDFDLELPHVTLFMLEASQSVPWAILAALSLVPVYFLLFLLPGGARLAHWARTGAPILGKIWMWNAQHEFASIFGSLAARRVLLEDALRCTAEALHDQNLARATRIVIDKCDRGALLSQAMSESIHFDRALTGLVAWGEANDGLPEAMRQAAALYEKEIELQVILLRRILPPILFITVACTLFTFVVTLFVPLVDLINNLSG
ncbi:MAG TPA: type II secretion system F family protein [Lacipirellula sp.]